jgi:aldehyde:ferredoxin oxidoreductase
MGFGSREHDQIPYRTTIPGTVEEYESCQDRYDDQLAEKYGVDIAGKTSEEKVAMLRGFRQEQYEKLQDSVYKRRGWNPEGIPTLETMKRLGINFPEVVELLRAHGVE